MCDPDERAFDAKIAVRHQVVIGLAHLGADASTASEARTSSRTGKNDVLEPSESGCPFGRIPLALMVQAVGASSASTSCRAS